MKRLLLTIFALLFIQGIAHSAPMVSSLSGNEITGTSFGNAPDVVFFDDYEAGVDGNNIVAGHAVFGDYSLLETGSNAPYYTDSAAVSGNLAFQRDLSLSYGGGSEVALPANTRDIFISWCLYLPADDNAPGEGNVDRINWKQMWIMGSSTTDDDLVVPTILGSEAWSTRYYFINGNDSDPGYGANPSLTLNKGTWVNWKVWIKGGYDDDGECKFWEVLSTGINQALNDTGVDTLKSGGAFEKVGIQAYGRQTDDCHPTFDDIYIAVGANAQARVEVTDNSTYLSSTKTAVQVVDDGEWSATSIDIEAWNQGGFANNAIVYLFVIDADGSVSNGLQGHFLNGTFYTGSTYTKLSNITASNITFS